MNSEEIGMAIAAGLFLLYVVLAWAGFRAAKRDDNSLTF